MRHRFLLLVSAAVVLTSCESTLAEYERSDHWEKKFFVQADVRDLVIAEDMALFATDKGFFHAGEDGRFRRSQAFLPRSASVVAYGFSPRRWDVYAVTELGHLLRSANRGRSFELVGEFPSIQIYDMALTAGGQLFVASSSGLLMADLDDAKLENAEERTHFLPWEMLVMALPIWRRANLGADTDPWHDWSIVLPGNVFRVEADPSEHGHVLAEVLDEGVYRSKNMGSSWEPCMTEEGERARGPIAFGPDGRVLVGRNLSENGGETFRALRPRHEGGSERPADLEPHSVASTSKALWLIDERTGGVYRSANGARWTRIGKPIDFYGSKGKLSAAQLAVDPDGEVWVGTLGHGIFRNIP